MSGRRFQVRRRFSSWIGELYEIFDTEDELVVATVNGDRAKERADEHAFQANRRDAERKEAAKSE